MGWRIVRQPNGLLARFSDIVDDFTHTDMTADEAMTICREQLGIDEAAHKVDAGVRDFVPWTTDVPGSGHDRWDDCIESIRLIHGDEEAKNTIAVLSRPAEARDV